MQSQSWECRVLCWICRTCSVWKSAFMKELLIQAELLWFAAELHLQKSWLEQYGSQTVKVYVCHCGWRENRPKPHGPQSSHKNKESQVEFWSVKAKLMIRMSLEKVSAGWTVCPKLCLTKSWIVSSFVTYSRCSNICCLLHVCCLLQLFVSLWPAVLTDISEGLPAL